MKTIRDRPQLTVLDKKKEIISFCLNEGILLTKQLSNKLQDPKVIETVHSSITTENEENPRLLLQRLRDAETEEDTENGSRPQSTRILDKPEKTPRTSEKQPLGKVKIVEEYGGEPKKWTVQDYVQHFNARYTQIAGILKQRQELSGATSIGRVRTEKDRTQVAFIGIVMEKRITKNNHVVLQVEDPTGMVDVVVSKKRAEAHEIAMDTMPDEVIGIVGSANGKGTVFANTVIYPDIPLKEIKKAPDEVYAVFTACQHFGSKDFLGATFKKFIDWLKGEEGTEEQKKIAGKIGYLFISGDLIEGIGIYPGQEEELDITDIKEQYAQAAKLLRQIPDHIHIILTPGNHDVVRLAEPQPKIYREYAEELYQLPNVTMTTNPAIVNIHSQEGFPGFDVLTYHGYSFDYYSERVPGIRNSGKNCSERTPEIMKYLLRRRHFCPVHDSNPYMPNPEKDHLVMEKVPDIFTAGHIHRSGIEIYRGVNIIACSTFQAKTDFQERVGHEPDPGKVPIMNLKTRKIRLLNFKEAA